MVCGYTVKAFCETEQNVIRSGKHSDPLAGNPKKRVEKDDIIIKVLHRDRFKQICEWAVAACRDGRKKCTDSSADMDAFEDDLQKDFLTANAVNELLDLLRSLHIRGIDKVRAGDLVEAKTFDAIFQGIYSATYDEEACDSCNTCEFSRCNNTSSGGGGGSSGGSGGTGGSTSAASSTDSGISSGASSFNVGSTTYTKTAIGYVATTKK